MKIRFDSAKKKKYISLVLIFLMAGSTAAYSALQAFTTWLRTNEAPAAPELPSSNVVDYALTAEQRNYMLRNGRTILDYKYKLACTACANQRSFIESAASQFPTQIFVQEIIDNSANNSTLSMTSYYGDKSLANPTIDQIFDALCELLVEPPVQCATRKI